jgi:hypothetical protein
MFTSLISRPAAIRIKEAAVGRDLGRLLGEIGVAGR